MGLLTCCKFIVVCYTICIGNVRETFVNPLEVLNFNYFTTAIGIITGERMAIVNSIDFSILKIISCHT